VRHDPLFLLWAVDCPTPADCSKAHAAVEAWADPDMVYRDVAVSRPGGVESRREEAHRLGDYFSAVELLPGRSSASFRVLFRRRPDAGQFWKDLMALALESAREAAPGARTSLEYRGDDEPTDRITPRDE
jgi:hypothetical protein